MSLTFDTTFTFDSIGVVHSPYREKFAIPRQPGLVTADQGYIELSGPCNREEILRGLEAFSHAWILFVFHEAMREQWKPMARPPRLGGNQKVGVFASRSPFRPNPIGQSVVKLEGIRAHSGQWRVHFSGGDLLHGTPVLDIKPYLPYADAIADANGAYAPDKPGADRPVRFSEAASASLARLETEYPALQLLIEQVIAQQPQPAYHRQDEAKIYGMMLYDLNIRWQQSLQDACVITVEKQR
ncbi:tRNA (N6-threonylcarbamoyladenosine(37)-N6)-methyltransferase TrmO [Pseudomaricurvus sp. HS19]|uniref:tRNA (N6-threonylcarbamoyladenosine(37)-N6)-methyltransferase TrmO n=1 Tax=Pseudomaricurvus sp. HS19 TaxID=2692626 RepID=UPI001368DCFA|nr:tRNA (N6-threonylcarbamoyladenosine(37)-N6)-methyltransferase TrmO [Pseudomaricurvus sp. HS19]